MYTLVLRSLSWNFRARLHYAFMRKVMFLQNSSSFLKCHFSTSNYCTVHSLLCKRDSSSGMVAAWIFFLWICCSSWFFIVFFLLQDGTTLMWFYHKLWQRPLLKSDYEGWFIWNHFFSYWDLYDCSQNISSAQSSKLALLHRMTILSCFKSSWS